MTTTQIETRHFRALIDPTTRGVGSKKFTAATSGIKRDGLELDIAGMRIDNFKANPVVLWNHDYMGQRLPIGKVTNIRQLKSRVDVEIEFDPDDEFAQEVERKFDQGYLNAVSVGVAIEKLGGKTGLEIVGSDLLDVSAVPVPGDPKSLMRRERSALRSLAAGLLEALADDEQEQTDPGSEGNDKQEIEIVTDPADMMRSEDSAGEIDWPEAAHRMVRLFLAGDSDRQTYNRLEKVYRKAGRTAPEWVEDIPREKIPGLFLEGEWEAHQTMVRSTALDQVNEAIDTLTKVRDDLAGVTESKAEEEEEAPADEVGTEPLQALLDEFSNEGEQNV